MNLCICEVPDRGKALRANVAIRLNFETGDFYCTICNYKVPQIAQECWECEKEFKSFRPEKFCSAHCLISYSSIKSNL